MTIDRRTPDLSSSSPLPPQLLADLDFLGKHLVTDSDVISAYRHGRAITVPAGTPLAVVLPESTEEVSRCLAAASQWQVPVVTRGAGSGLSGGANAVDGCLVVQGLALASIPLSRGFAAWLAAAIVMGAGTAMVYPTLLAASATSPSLRDVRQ